MTTTEIPTPEVPPAATARRRIASCLRLSLIALVLVAALAACGLVVAARWHWVGELAASFRWQLGGLGVLGVLLLLVARARRPAVVVALLAAWLLWPGARLHVPRVGGAPDGTPLRVATINVLLSNRDGAAVRAWIRAEDPDVVALQEVNDFWLRELDGLADCWPYRVTAPAAEEAFRKSTNGMALVSRRPLRPVEVFAFSNGLAADLDLGGQVVRLIAAHAERPGPPGRLERRNAVLDAVAGRAAAAPACVVLADLNTSSGSPAFGRLLRAGQLRDTRQGFGRQPTWQMERPIPGLWVDIDHVLVSEHLVATGRRVGGPIGSDHRPVVADLVLQAPGPR